MNNKKKLEIEDAELEFAYTKNRSNLKIEFNRISFIFFIFFLISVIFTIHLLHLGSRNFGEGFDSCRWSGSSIKYRRYWGREFRYHKSPHTI